METRHSTTRRKTITQNAAIERLQRDVVCLELSMQHILEYLSVINILLCRRVCKKWRIITDEFLENKTVEGPYDNNMYLRNMQLFPVEQLLKQKYRQIQFAYYFPCHTAYGHCNPIKLKSFMDQMSKHSELGLSPFIGGGRVCLAESLFSENSTVFEFFKLFGRHIHYLKIKEHVLPFNFEPAKFVEIIRNCLTYVPNLKQFTLRLEDFSCNKFTKLYRKAYGIRESKGLYIPELHFSGSRLPAQLNSFSLIVFEGFSVPTLHELISNNIIKPYYEGKLQRFGLTWPNNLSLKMGALKELTLTIGYARSGSKTPLSYPSLESFTKDKFFDAPIEKLHLKTVSFQKIELSKLMKIIEMVPSLQYLKLSYLIWASIRIDSAESCWSNNIHTLELTNYYGVSGVPYQLFRALPKLKYFTLCQAWALDYKTEQNIDTNMYFIPERLFIAPKISIYDTKLWEILPNLEMAAVQFEYHKCKVYKGHPCGWDLGSTNCLAQDKCRISNVIGTKRQYRKYFNMDS